MPIIKLLDGQRINLTVSGVAQVEGKFGPQYKFVGTTPDDGDAALFLNVEPAERQLSRIGLTTHNIVGKTVEIERVNRGGTLYTNINLPSRMPQPDTKPVATSGKEPYSVGGPLPYETESETGAPPNKAEGFQRLFTAYDLCLSHALSVAQKMDKQNIGSSPEAVAAIAATLLIQADRQGLTR